MGRCFTMSPRPEQIKKGIKRIVLDIAVNSSISVHTPGLLITYPTQKITFFGESVGQFQNAQLGKYYHWTLNRDFHKLKGEST